MAGEEAEDRVTTSSDGGVEAWGTLEELLLACAVNRHGSDSWDSIAMELQKRTSSRSRTDHTNTDNDNSFSNTFTPLTCRHKYRDLKRRFNVENGDGLTAGEMDGDGDLDSRRDELPCIIDELRKIRVEELRREVQRHDSSIVSLQLKVKRLKEEEEEVERREKSSKSDEAVRAADLITQTHGNGSGTREERMEQEETSPPPDEAAGVMVPAAEEAEDRSFNESNSTSHKDENRRATAEEEEEEEERGSDRGPLGDGSEESDRVQMENDVGPDKGCSGNSWRTKAETSGSSRPGESNELKDSVSVSKRDVNGVVKQSSDVLSSASLSRRRKRGWRGGVDGDAAGSSSGDEVDVEEEEEGPPANGRISDKSQTLIRVMESVRSHKHGLVFERRLPSQDTGEYRNMIRQHMDLDTVQSNLDKGVYWDSHLSFYRDLLLLFTNAVQFYPESSAEHVAAWELRKLVNQEIHQVTWKPKLQPLDPVAKKPQSATATIFCRHLVPAPPSPSYSREEDEEEKITVGNGIKPKPKANGMGVNGGGHGHGTEEGSVSAAKGLSATNLEKPANSRNYNVNNNNKKKGNNVDENQYYGNKANNKQEKAAGPAARKKQGVANFLRRMEQNSPAREDVENGNDGELIKKERDDHRMPRTGKRKKAGGINENSKGGGAKEVMVVARRTSGRMQGKKDQEKEDAVARRQPRRKRGGGSDKEIGGGGQKKKRRR